MICSHLLARQNGNHMKYNFDEYVERRGTYSVKWDGAFTIPYMLPQDTHWTDETIPMFLADMDLACPPALVEAMHRVADHRIFGYTMHKTDPRYNQCIIDWYQRRYNTEIKEEWLLYSNGSVTGIDCMLNTFLNPGEGVIIQPPVYGHFNGMIEHETPHRVVHNSMINTDGYYTIDWEDFEQKCAVPTNRAFILCSPSNPVGRVWTIEELQRMAEICKKHNVLVISDEIHSDILRQGVTHHPIISVVEDYSNIIMVIGANKSFNVAGLHVSNIIIPDESLRGIFDNQFGMVFPTPFGVAAQIAAYDESEEWLDELNLYLDANIDHTIEFFKERMPKLKAPRPEGTYMFWLDFREYGISDEDIVKRVYVDANVLLQYGIEHDPINGEGFQRMSIACPRPMLDDALERIANAFSDL